MTEPVLLNVFVEGSTGGNAVAVFPDASGMTPEQMQALATELGLSETSFVIATDATGYDLRIFTPREEIPFAGHPTLGSTWALLHLGRLEGDRFTQRTVAGETEVWRDGDLLWFRRTGTSAGDLDETHVRIDEDLADALGLEPRDIGFDARELGRSGAFRPAFSDAGLEHLCVPVRDVATLGRVTADEDRLSAISHQGAYCFSADRPGYVQARGFFPAYGITEDPATGSGAAALGVYMAARIGDIDFQVLQGIEMGVPSRLYVKARSADVAVGGRCAFP